MLIGIISDTHDDMAAIKAAVEVFNNSGVRHVLHAGDLVSPFTFEVLSGLDADFTGIFGNNDGDRILLTAKSGGRIFGQPHAAELGGKKIVIIHEPDIAVALASSGQFDIVIYGHTHLPDIRTVGKTLVINPGKAARLHKGKSTAAILDTDKMEAKIIDLPV